MTYDPKWSYEWKRITLLGETEDPDYLKKMLAVGWEPVSDNDRPAELRGVSMPGLMLMRREMKLTRAFHRDQSAILKTQLDAAMQPFLDGTAEGGTVPFGAISHGVDPAPVVRIERANRLRSETD